MATIQGVYVALFGRPADPTGLAFFNTATQNGADLSAIGDLASTQEYKDRFKDQSNVQIITAIYQSLFGRDPEAAGLNFFVDALNNGTLNINNIAIAILDGAQGADKTIVDTKVAAADAFTAALDTPTEIGAYSGNAAAAQGITFLKGITTTAPTAAAVDAAVAGLVTADSAGNTITAVVTTVETISVGTGTTNTTDKNDTINALASATNDTNAPGDDAWVWADHTIDGGLGTDTFNVELDDDQAVAANGLKSVEIINIKSTGAAADLDATEAKDATQVWNNVSTANLSVTGLASTVTVGLKGNIAANTTTFAYADTSGANTVNVALDGATTTGAVTIAGVETVNIANSGTSSVTALTVAAATAVNVTGSGSLTLGSPSTAIETVDASAFTGALTMNAVAQTALSSLKSGSGGDFLTVSANVSSKDVVVDAGAGTDTINVENNGAATKMVTLTGGTGADQFVLGSNAALANADHNTDALLKASLVTITDFAKAEDAIKVNTGGNGRDTLLTAELADIADEATLLAAATKAASYTDNSKASVFVYGGDSYILVNDGDANFDGGEGLIKVTGVTDVADFTAANFQTL